MRRRAAGRLSVKPRSRLTRPHTSLRPQKPGPEFYLGCLAVVALKDDLENYWAQPRLLKVSRGEGNTTRAEAPGYLDGNSDATNKLESMLQMSKDRDYLVGGYRTDHVIEEAENDKDGAVLAISEITRLDKKLDNSASHS